MDFSSRFDLEKRLDQAAAIINVCMDSLGHGASTNEDIENALWGARDLIEDAKELVFASDSIDDEDDGSLDIDNEEDEVDDKPKYWWDLAFTPVGDDDAEVELALQDEAGEGAGDQVDEEAAEGADEDEARITATFVVLIDKE